MKKSGFTLSELLVALVIIGVVGAITSPIINNLLPDKNKVAVLKLHKVITDINEQLLNNPTYYYTDGSCHGFTCIQEAMDYKDATGVDKYSLLLQKHLQLKSDVNATSFTTIDGNVWTFDTSSANFDNPEANYTIFQVDIAPNKSGSTIYSASNKKNIDTFRFKVNPDGSVDGDDSLTKAYLQNPYKLNDRKADYNKAGDLEDTIPVEGDETEVSFDELF